MPYKCLTDCIELVALSGKNCTAPISYVESHILDSFTLSEKQIASRVTVFFFNL